MANDPTGFTNMGGIYKPGDLAIESVDKSQDSLTQFLRSLTNLLGMSGQDLFKTAGTAVSGAKEQIGQARGILDQPIDFWSKILSGDRSAMSEVLAPEVSTIVGQYDAAKKSVQQFQPRGGGRSTMMAELPFRQASDISRLFQTIRPQAATQLNTLSGSVGNLAQMLGQLGLGEYGIGTGLLGTTLQGLLARRGQNVQENENTQKMVADIGKSIGELIAALKP